MLEKLTLSKMSQMSRAMKNNSESLTLTEMRVQNYSMTRCNETWWPERKGKQTLQARPTAAKGSPLLQAEVMQI